MRRSVGLLLVAASIAACAAHEGADEIAAPPQAMSPSANRLAAPVNALPSAPAWTADGAPVAGSLADFPGARFPVDPGSCYAVAFEARPITASPLVAPFFRLTTPADRREERGEPLTTRSSARSGLFCPSQPGILELYFVAQGAPTRSAGQGTIVAQLFRGPPLARAASAARTAPPDPNRYTLPYPIQAGTTRPPAASAPAPAPPSRGPVYRGEDCSRTCFLARNRCVGRCSSGGGDGTSFRRWCEDECSHQQDECRQSCLDRFD